MASHVNWTQYRPCISHWRFRHWKCSSTHFGQFSSRGFWRYLRRWNSSSTVLPPGKRLEKDDTIIIPDKIFHLLYRGIVGSLGYFVIMTHPDLVLAYFELSKYVQCPQPDHILAVHHVILYLRGTYELGIRYHLDVFHPNQVWGWVDTDWAGDINICLSAFRFKRLFISVLFCAISVLHKLKNVFFTRFKRVVLIEIPAWVKRSLSPWCLLTNINSLTPLFNQTSRMIVVMRRLVL